MTDTQDLVLQYRKYLSDNYGDLARIPEDIDWMVETMSWLGSFVNLSYPELYDTAREILIVMRKEQ